MGRKFFATHLRPYGTARHTHHLLCQRSSKTHTPKGRLHGGKTARSAQWQTRNSACHPILTFTHPSSFIFMTSTSTSDNEIAFQTFTLDNGLRVIHAPSPTAVAYCGYAIKAGTRFESPHQQGMAHFVEHLLFKG